MRMWRYVKMNVRRLQCTAASIHRKAFARGSGRFSFPKKVTPTSPAALMSRVVVYVCGVTPDNQQLFDGVRESEFVPLAALGQTILQRKRHTFARRAPGLVHKASTLSAVSTVSYERTKKEEVTYEISISHCIIPKTPPSRVLWRETHVWWISSSVLLRMCGGVMCGGPLPRPTKSALH